MARLNIAEKRSPQDGRIKLRMSGREVDIRVSIIPMLHGEGVVMRVLDKDAMKFSLSGVGMEEDTCSAFRNLIRSSAWDCACDRSDRIRQNYDAL